MAAKNWYGSVMEVIKPACLVLWTIILSLGTSSALFAADQSPDQVSPDAPKSTLQHQNPHAPLFTLIFDDGNDTDYKLALDIVASEKAVACSAIVTDWIGKKDFLTAEQILGLRDAGWEIMSHTATHPNLRTLTEENLQTELSRSLGALQTLGIVVHNIVYPYNKSTPLVRQVAATMYRSGRGGSNSLNNAATDRYFLTSFAGHDNLKAMEARIDEASRTGTWCIIYHHRINELVHIDNRTGTFQRGEPIVFSPSGATGTFVPSLWYSIGWTLAFTPTQGKVQIGDTAKGTISGASATIFGMGIDEREYLRGLLHYVRTVHPEMQIVTVDQGLDLLK